jgi:dihydropteroate synthase
MFTLNCRGKLLFIDQPIVMGILNLTPDSFFTGSRISNEDETLFRAEQMLQDGASILDIGGQSTRPGSQRVSEKEELERIIPSIKVLHERFPDIPISIDTFYARVAERAVEAGAAIINDVSAGSIDGTMLEIVAKLKVPYVLMHMTGDPQTMQNNPTYNNVVTEVFDFLNFRIKKLQDLGINDIIVDPGFGFGKTIQHNFQLLSGLAYFSQLKKPLLIGLSRKGTVYKTLNVNAEEALNGTTVLNTISLMKGAHILRVHDVKEAVQAVKLVNSLNVSAKNQIS